MPQSDVLYVNEIWNNAVPQFWTPRSYMLTVHTWYKMFKYSYNLTPTPGKEHWYHFICSIYEFCRYAIGDRLSPDHQRTILQRLLPYHPECEKKIGPGVDYITVSHPPPHCFIYRSACIVISHRIFLCSLGSISLFLHAQMLLLDRMTG